MEEKRKPLTSIDNRYVLHHPISDTHTKHTAFGLAQEYRQKGDNKNAEAFAIKAIKLGSENLAPKLLAEIATETQSALAAFMLAKHYWKSKKVEDAYHWATVALKYSGGDGSAIKFVAEIEAHQRAVELHKEVMRY